MRIATIICSFNSPELTKIVYDGLKNQEGHDLYILENSTDEDKIFDEGRVIDLGRDNIGFGGMHDYIWRSFRDYDFVGIWNNDVYDIPENYIEVLKKYLNPRIGIASSAINREGTGWEQMTQLRKDGYREVNHIEDVAAYFNTKLFGTFKSYSPFGRYGVNDVAESLLSSRAGFKNIVIDEIKIGHLLSGARKAAGVMDEYLKRGTQDMLEWIAKYPDLKQMYENYYKSITRELTVVIPNYNHNHLLRRAILSAMHCGANPNIIVIDDRSEIDPWDEIKDLPIQYFRHDKNRGLSASRNTAIANTKSKWILPLDADDELIGGFQKLWDARNESDIIYGNLVWRESEAQLKPVPDVTYENFLNNNQILGSSIYKRDIWKAIGGYWEEPKECYEDWDFWARASKRGYNFKYIDTDVYLYAGTTGGMCDRLGKKRDYNVKLVTDHIKNA